MKIRIYQIDHEKDTERVEFLNLKQLQKLYGSSAINGRIYQEVFCGEVTADTLDDVYGMFNLKPPWGHAGRFMSISDIVEIMDDPERNGYYFCDRVGFPKVDFTPGKGSSIITFRPEWGLYPQDFRPRIFWGARAIITEDTVDLLPDRQSFNTAVDVDKPEISMFLAWANKRALPYLNQLVKKHDTAHIEFASQDGSYFCVAEDRGSGGYLYIGAYTQN